MSNFQGFNPQQQFLLMQKLGYQGSLDDEEMNKFLAASPSAAAKLGAWTKAAQQIVGGGSNIAGMAEGGVVSPFDQAKANLATVQGQFATAQQTAQTSPSDPAAQQGILEAQKNLKAAQDAYNIAHKQYTTQNVPAVGEATAKAIQTPQELLQAPQVQQMQEKPEQLISADAGQVSETAPVATPATVAEVERVQETPQVTAATIDATTVSDEARKELDDLEAAKGTLSPEGTVRGQLEILMEDFEGDGTPPWASGAMRKAMSVMQSRGLGASSIAGQAVTTAAMESALAIASQDAAAVAKMEMQNLSNEQQTTIFKTQQRLSTLLSDQSAENAAKQFNAASQNQVKQFMADLEVNSSKFNAEQINTIRKFNAGEENTIEQFNAQVENLRDQFNAQNSLVIAQANAQWRQNIETANTAAQNTANMQFAQQVNGLTSAALDQIWQRERDLLAFAFTKSESAAERDLQLLLADKQAKFQADSDRREGIGIVVGSIVRGLFGGA